MKQTGVTNQQPTKKLTNKTIKKYFYKDEEALSGIPQFLVIEKGREGLELGFRGIVIGSKLYFSKKSVDTEIERHILLGNNLIQKESHSDDDNPFGLSPIGVKLVLSS